MTTPLDATSNTGHWWVMEASVTSRGQAQFTAVESATRPPDTAVSHVAAGPFNTRADAEAWITQQQGPNLPNVNFPSLPNPLGFLAGLNWIQEIGHWIGLFEQAVTDIHMYISLGWLALGLMLLIVGLLWWFRSTDAGRQFAQGAAEAGVIAA